RGFGPDDATLRAGRPDSLLLYALDTGKVLAKFSLGVDVRFASLSADGNTLVAAGYEDMSRGPNVVLHRWNRRTEKLLSRFRGPLADAWLGALAISPDGTRLAVAGSNSLRIWALD